MWTTPDVPQRRHQQRSSQEQQVPSYFCAASSTDGGQGKEPFTPPLDAGLSDSNTQAQALRET